MSVTAENSSSHYKIYTDGACSGNPGPGGWGVLIRHLNDDEIEFFGGETLTTNNRMELTAALKGLEAVPRIESVSQKVILYTDSMYVRDGMSQWIFNWKRRNWQTAEEKGIKNLDLWKKLDQLAQQHTVEWMWIKAHNGHPENERVDFLARNAIVHMMAKNSV